MTRKPYAERLGRIKDSVDRQRYETGKREAHSTAGRVRRDLTATVRFWGQVSQGLWWIWRRLLKPLLRPLRWLAERLWDGVRWSWDETVYATDQYGKRVFIKWRAGMFILVYVGFFFYGLLPVIELVWDIGLYVATAKRDEPIYLTKSQEILPDENVHSVIGCHELPCTDQNSVYFRVRPVIFHQLWSLTHHSWRDGPPLFFPDNVAAAVPPGVNDCIATSYGIRIKLFMRGFDWYPDILAASCQPARAP